VIGDVVPPRERGRYQGLFGAVFGIASVAGPLLGGVIVESISWRWIFYVNLPVGILALVVVSASLPATAARARPSIDYLGAGLLAAALSAIVLVTSLGGTTWAWGSGSTIVVGGLGVVLLIAFVATERRAREPVLPPSLLRNRVFAIGGALSMIVGFALFGAVTFLPLYFQTVDAATPTGSGLRLVPMLVGVLTMSILSGQLITRYGRYKPFPIIGTALMTIALLLLSGLNVGTSTVTASVYLLILGLGLGSTMQVLVLAVQNAVDFSNLGAATSGVTLARGIGGSLGTAVFGTVFSTQLTSHLKGVLTGPLASQLSSGGRLTGTQVLRLAEPARSLYQHAYVSSLQPVFVMAGAVAGVGFVLSLFLPQRTLREAAAQSTGLEDSLAAPRSADSLAEIERALAMATTRDERMRFHRAVAERSGIELSPAAVWALVRIDEHGLAGARTQAEQAGVDPVRIAAVVGELRDRGMIAGEDGSVDLTAAGRDETKRAVNARRELLTEALADDSADRRPDVQALLERLARSLCGDPAIGPPAPPAAEPPRAVGSVG
jgi:MFS family permease